MNTEQVEVTSDLINKVLAMSDEEFKEIVDKDVRDVLSPDFAAALRTEALRDRWTRSLLIMKKSVESQIGAKRADLGKLSCNGGANSEQHAEYNRWRAGALRFKNGVETRLLELRSFSPAEVFYKQERNQTIVENTKLREAIREHRETTLVVLELEPSEADELLWENIG